MKFIIKIIQGMMIGIGNITPGVSGSMIANSFNIYEELIDALNMFSKKPIKAVLGIWEYLVGVVLGFLVGGIFISQLLKVIPLYITIFFVGLIFGSLPDILKEERNTKIKWYHILIVLIAIGLVLLLLLLEPINISNITGFKLYVVYALIGFLITVPLIIPGLSGATVLMVLGLYSYFTNTLSDLVFTLTNLDFGGFFNTFTSLLVMVISAFIGLLLIAKLIKYIIDNHKSSFNMAIIGLLLVAPVNIIIATNKEVDNLFGTIDFWKVLLTIIAFAIGFLITFLMGNKREVETVEE